MAEPPEVGPRALDMNSPSAARAYDYYLGGAHNFAPDREFADEVRQLVPWIPNIARLNRSFLHRVVQHFLDEGITQFLDLGSGIPTAGNVHEIAQARVPNSRVVYVDFEPIAYSYATTLLANNPNAGIVQADIREPEVILRHAETRRLLDFSRPIGLLMVGVLLFVGPEDSPSELIDTYVRELVPGSLLAISQITDEKAEEHVRAQMRTLVNSYAAANEPVHLRDREEVRSWFHGTELIDPGVTFLPDWRPASDHESTDVTRALGYGGVGRVR